MKKLKNLWVLFFLVVLSYGQTSVQYRELKNIPFQPGEKLVFRVHYGWFTAGTATFMIDEKIYTYKGKECFHFHGEGKSASSFNWFYKVRDYFDSYCDKKGIFPYYYTREANEGDYHYYDRVEFDLVNKKVKGKQGIFKAPAYTQDMLSAFYYARCLPLQETQKGDIFKIKVFLDDGVYDLGMKILGKDTIDTKFGLIACIKIAPLVVVGRVFKGKEDMIIWISDDENRIPVRIKSPIIVGSIKADLVKYKGLKYPFKARLKRKK